MYKVINLDMDGVWCDLYGVENWLEDLINHNARPYREAKPLVNMSWFARTIHELQNDGWEINIISWLAKNSNEYYDEEVRLAKIEWINKHLPSVEFNHISIIKYGEPKENYGVGYLFDDEKHNRDNWNGIAFDEKDLIKRMRTFL